MISNINKLIIHKTSHDAIPNGGGIADGLAFFSDKNKIADGFNKATKWVNEAINLVRMAKDPNPYKNYNDEEIAGVILEKIINKQHG